MGGKLSRPVYLAPPPSPQPIGYQNKNHCAYTTYFDLSDCEDISILNMIQVKFSLSDCSVYLVAGVEDKLSRPVYLDPHPPEYQSKIIFAKFSHFKLSECDDVLIINIIQVKFSCFLCRIVLYA